MAISITTARSGAHVIFLYVGGFISCNADDADDGEFDTRIVAMSESDGDSYSDAGFCKAQKPDFWVT